MSNDLDPGKERHSDGPDLGQNCLQSLSTDDKRVEMLQYFNIFGRKSLDSFFYKIKTKGIRCK